MPTQRQEKSNASTQIQRRREGKKTKERSHEANPILGVHNWGYIGEFEPL